MIDYFEGPIIDVPDADARTSQARRRAVAVGALLAADRGAARRRRHRLPRPAPARRRDRHRPTASRRRPTSASRRRIRAEYHRRRAGPLASRCAATRAPVTLPRQRRRRHVPHRPAPLDRRRQLHRRAPRARSRSRSARCCRGGWTNLLPAGKNIGTTHITNGCYRLHPVEWNIGEVAGALAAFCLDRATTPHARCTQRRRAPGRLPGPARRATASSCTGPTYAATEDEPIDEISKETLTARR